MINFKFNKKKCDKKKKHNKKKFKKNNKFQIVGDYETKFESKKKLVSFILKEKKIY